MCLWSFGGGIDNVGGFMEGCIGLGSIAHVIFGKWGRLAAEFGGDRL